MYASTCLSKGSRVTLTIESVTALRDGRRGTTGGRRPRRGGRADATERRGGKAGAGGNGNKRQRPNPRPDLKRAGREADERETNRAGSSTS